MQKIIVDTIPGFRMPSIFFSQGDVGTQFAIDLRSRFGDALPASPTITIQATKPSGFGFSVSATSVSNGVATFTTTTEMTDEAGRFPAELKVVKDSVTLYTANFYMDGEATTHPEGTIDGSAEEVIPELTQLVERVEDAASSVLDMTVNATTLAAGSQATYSYDEETNTATFGIPQGEAGAGAAGVTANAYSSSATYAVGDYVIHNSNLYRCTTAITTAEAFTAAHWTQVVLADDVSDLKSNITPNLNWEHGALATSTGAEVSDTVSIRTKGYLQLSGQFNIEISAGLYGNRVKFYKYDNNFNFLEAESWITADQSYTADSSVLYRIQISLVDTRYEIDLDDAINQVKLLKTTATDYYGSPFEMINREDTIDFYGFLTLYDWEHGAFATATGAEVSDTVSIRTKNYIKFTSPFELRIGSAYRIKFVQFDTEFNFVQSGSFITENQTFTPDVTKLYRVQISVIDTRYDIDLDDAITKNNFVRNFDDNKFYKNVKEIEDSIVENSGSVVVESSDNNICFESPSANGMTAVQVNDYFPFRTDRLLISDIQGNASIGLCYGDSTFENGYRLLTTRDTLTFSLHVNGVKTREHTLTMPVDPVGHYLQIQHTGRAVIISVFDTEMKWYSMVGRFEFGNYTDARNEAFTSTWKTYVCAMTTSYTASDFAAFSHYDTAMRTGENASSIRFLTYEDGSFIQKGDWLYYLVEGTAQTIQDLFTAMFKINLKTNELQMIGSLFVVRDDGTDDGLLLGDSSTKVVYDRNDGKWKGISCGMEYQGLGYDNDRPKLYFETTQNLLDGGIIIVHGAEQLKDSNGLNVGTSETVYTEDFDFYYDSINEYWVVIGNRVSAGAIVYHSPNLKNGYTEAFRITDVPTGVRDTGNQFIKCGSTRYITTGGSVNQLGIRSASDGEYLGALTMDFPLSEQTSGPWCSMCAYNEGDRVSLYAFSFDRVDLSGESYDHGSMYCWKAFDESNNIGKFKITLPKGSNDIPNTTNPIFTSVSPLSYRYKRKFARRDWYNDVNTYGLYSIDLNTNPLLPKSDILHKVGTNFTLTYKKFDEEPNTEVRNDVIKFQKGRFC